MNGWSTYTLEQSTKQLQIIRYPDPILNEKSLECIETDLKYINEQISQMTTLMNNMNGVGLAAVQVGILKRFAIIKDSAGKSNLIINPVLIATENLIDMREGCLSLPYFFETVARFDEITISYRDIHWVEHTAIMSGQEAQCLQHELAHMDGQLILGYVSKQKQDMWKKKATKKGVL